MSVLLDRVTIATKCAESWDAMSGDDRVRFCKVCAKSVYNVAAMTEVEADRLVLENEGNVCTRLFRREDGRVVTRDCAREYRPRLLVNVAYAAALVMPAAMSAQEKPAAASVQNDAAEVRGTVVNFSGDPVGGAVVRMDRGKTAFKTTASKDGGFVFSSVKPGSYHLVVMVSGIQHDQRQVDVVAGQVVTLSLTSGLDVQLGEVTSVVEPSPVSLKDRKLDLK